MIQSFAYFPTIIYRDEKPEWVDYTLKITEKYFSEQNSQFNLTQTTHMGNDVEFKFFTDYLLATSYDILKNQGYMVDKYEFYISGLWGQEVKSQTGTNIHLHKNSQLCGWFFLETPENGSYPVYYDTRDNKHIMELDYSPTNEITVSTSSIHFNNVIPGTVLLSNSWMQHQLIPGTSEKSTKSVHFIISSREKICNMC